MRGHVLKKLVKCRVCKKKISINADNCPSCGEPVDKEYYVAESKKGNNIIVAFGVIFGLYYFATMAIDRENRKIKNTPEYKLEEKNRKIKESEELYLKIKKIPASYIYLNMNGYNKLTKLNPENNVFQNKLKEYRNKVSNMEMEIGAPSKMVNMDGVPVEIAIYWNHHLKDPSSLDDEKCSNVGYSSKGWMYECTYRAKNSFGALVLGSNTYAIKKDVVTRTR